MKYIAIVLIMLLGIASDACAMESKTAKPDYKLSTPFFKVQDQFALRPKRESVAAQEIFFRNEIDVQVMVLRTLVADKHYNGHPIISVNADVETIQALKRILFQEKLGVKFDSFEKRERRELTVSREELSQETKATLTKVAALIRELRLDKDPAVKRSFFEAMRSAKGKVGGAGAASTQGKKS